MKKKTVEDSVEQQRSGKVILDCIRDFMCDGVYCVDSFILDIHIFL